MPPSTDPVVQTAAIRNARRRSASTIGISSRSGGSGKNELSANAKPNNAAQAWRLVALAIIHSYRPRNQPIFGFVALSVMNRCSSSPMTFGQQSFLSDRFVTKSGHKPVSRTGCILYRSCVSLPVAFSPAELICQSEPGKAHQKKRTEMRSVSRAHRPNRRNQAKRQKSAKTRRRLQKKPVCLQKCLAPNPPQQRLPQFR